MIVTKMALPRRTFLRGLGATLALPLLDAMVPALSVQARTAANPVRRLGYVFIPMGMNPVPWIPRGEGSITELSPSLAALTPHLDHLTVVDEPRDPERVYDRQPRVVERRVSELCSREADRRERLRAGHHGRSDSRKSDWRPDADPISRARHRLDRSGGELRQRLCVLVHE